MNPMKRAWIAAALVLASCSEKKEDSSCCSPEEPAPATRSITRSEGVVLTGLPESPELAVCDARGRWGVKAPQIDHSIVDPKEKAPLLPREGHPQMTLYRDSLPFPQVTWKSGDWEVTQLVFPVGKGFVARYHVMNHGEDARTGQLRVWGAGASIASADKPASEHLEFDLKVEPGVSQFFLVTTADLAGKISEDALDQATARWEKLLGGRAVKLPDPALVTEYFAGLAGQKLGVPGSAETTAKIEAMLVRREEKALRLMAATPESWHVESIEVVGIPTDFGPLSFRYQGAYNNRTFELKPGCAPPDGFIVAVPDKLVARIDGKEAPSKDGALRVPSGARFVEVSYPR
jgi:hypothetical protein